MDQSSSFNRFIKRAPVLLAVGLLRAYQGMTLGGPRRCRFTPSCSEFMREALVQEGLFKGLAHGTTRLLKCHPWHPGGYDPVDLPEAR